MKYKVGDKVRIRKDLKPYRIYGDVMFVTSQAGYQGKICTISKCLPGWYLIEGDVDKWQWSGEMFEPVPIYTEKIVITSDGVTTTARKHDGKNLIKEAKAVCSKDDTFNFDVGAKLAMERLMAKDKPKLYNGKVVCVSSNSFALGYTKGKIYQFRNGRTLDDDGTTRPSKMTDAIEDFKDIERRYPGVWLEVVE